MAFCTNCGSETGGARFCPECGTPVAASTGQSPADPAAGGQRNASGAQGRAAGSQDGAGSAPAGGGPAPQSIDPRMAGAIAYFWPLAVVFLFAEPHKSIRFVRFHSLQSIFLAAGLAVVAIGFGIFSLIPLLGWVVGLFGLFLPLIWAGTAIFLGIKAYGGEEPHLPIIGDLVDKQC